MSWVTVIWSMTAAACLLLTALHLLVWSRRRTAWGHALCALMAVGTVGVAVCEFWMMRAETAGQFATALRWAHVPVWVVIVALVAFVRVYLGAGRLWLAWGICILRTVSLLLNFLVGQNLNFIEVTRIRRIPFLGEAVSVGEGLSNPCMLVGQLSMWLLVLFVADATLTVWRQNQRDGLLVLAGSILFFVAASTVQGVLVLGQFVYAPMTLSLLFLGTVMAMGLELSGSVLRALKLADDLRESEERMALAADAAGVGVWVWSLARNRIWGSERWLTQFGFAPATTPGFEAVLERIHPDDRGAVERDVKRAVTDGLGYVGEYRVVLPTGDQRWIAARGRIRADPDVEPAQMLGVAVDITQRKEAEEALRLSEERYRILFDRANQGICVLSADGTVVSANESFAQMHGYTTGEMVGTALSSLDTPESSRLASERIRRILAGEAMLFEVEHYHKDGHVFPLEVSASRVSVAGASYIQAFSRDVTERMRTERELAKQRNELARVVGVSTMGQLAASLAHELNQPLGAILRNAEAAELLLREPVPDLEEVRAILEDVRRDDRRAGVVIDRMRSLMKHRSVEVLPLDLGVVAGEVLALVRVDAEMRRVQLELEAAPGLPPVCGDRVQLQQVLVNLLLNAMDAVGSTSRGDPRVTVRVRPAHVTVEVSVSDNGPGIPVDKLARVFEPYYTSKPNGLGMGLAISRSIIEAHGGLLWGESKAGGGATFTFSLPLAEASGTRNKGQTAGALQRAPQASS